jgi:hypothetical protein
MSDRSGQQIVILTTTWWWQRLAVGKQATHMERFNLKKLSEVEGKEISNRFASLENLDTKVDVNEAWETMREYIKISAKVSLGYYELKNNKPWFDEGCSKLLDQRKQYWMYPKMAQSLLSFTSTVLYY